MLFSKAESVSIIYTQSGYLVAALQRSVPVPTPLCQLDSGCCVLRKEQWGSQHFQHRHGWPEAPFRLPHLSHQLFCLWGTTLCQQSLIWKTIVIYRQQRVLSRPSHPAQALQVSFSGNEVQSHFAGLAVQRPALVQKIATRIVFLLVAYATNTVMKSWLCSGLWHLPGWILWADLSGVDGCCALVVISSRWKKSQIYSIFSILVFSILVVTNS